jgi:cytochrome c biogenesis protein
MTEQNAPTASRQMSLSQKWWDFLGSMRLAISLLTILSIASAVGTMVKQNEPMINYVNQFGAFWAPWFGSLGLYDVYNQPWFLVILLVLLISTSICLIRNTPKMLRDMREFKNHNRTNTLLHLHEHARWQSTLSVQALTHDSAQILQKHGYQVRASKNADGVYFAAKRGRYNRLGYIFTHLAIIVICIGGLLDSELSIRAQVLLFGKQPFSNVAIQIPDSGILSDSTLSYRGNISVAEGKTIDYALLDYNQSSQLVQKLPFNLHLDKFTIDYYSTGMPKRFASDVTVQDKTTGETFKQTIEVNHPLRYKGVAVYQASFTDGGSSFKLGVYPMTGTVSSPAMVDAVMFKNHEIAVAGNEYTIEWREFKAINVEDVSGTAPKPAQDISPLAHAMRPTGMEKKFESLGPSIQFVLRDKAGQGVEFRNYTSPVTLDGQAVILSGMRTNPDEDFRYLRIPADGEQSIGDFMRLRAALSSSVLRERAIRQYAQTMAGADSEQFVSGTTKMLEVFAQGGLAQLGQLLERDLPETQRDKMASSLVKALVDNLWELLNVARVAEGLKPLADTERNRQFARMLMVSYSDSLEYGSPVYVQLQGFEHLQASVFQMTRSPGQFWVYLGSLMLVLGTLAMTFIRERRLWLHIKPNENGEQVITLAASSTRRTFDYLNKWQKVQDDLRGMG